MIFHESECVAVAPFFDWWGLAFGPVWGVNRGVWSVMAGERREGGGGW